MAEQVIDMWEYNEAGFAPAYWRMVIDADTHMTLAYEFANANPDVQFQFRIRHKGHDPILRNLMPSTAPTRVDQDIADRRVYTGPRTFSEQRVYL